jgi:hypothetical protein
MKYLAVDDLVAPRGTFDLIWAGGRGFGPSIMPRRARARAPGPRRRPVSPRLAAPVRESAGRLRADANGRNSGNGEDNRE